MPSTDSPFVAERVKALRELRDPSPERRPWPSAIAKIALDTALWGRYSRPGAWCNICGWRGVVFRGGVHSERGYCPSCGSVARDRFIHACWAARLPLGPSVKALETSPRLGRGYARHMRGLCDYLSSDYDLGAHKGQVQLDLQDMSLPTESLDILVTSHVLEHVEHTERALREIARVLKPQGRAIIMVPMPSGVTHVPAEPEYHMDNTLVYWRFGWDLGDRIREAGLQARPLVTADLVERVRSGEGWPGEHPEVDVASLLEHAPPADELEAVVNRPDQDLLWLHPSYFFIAWEVSAA